MAQIIITDAKVRIDSSAATYTDISNNVRRVVINYNAETADDTVMGDATRSSKGGTQDNGGTEMFSSACFDFNFDARYP